MIHRPHTQKRRCVHELFESIAARQPERMAVVFERQRLTYGELNTQANRLAHHLRALGVGPEARVGLCVERSLNMIVGLLGILKAGGAYVPLESEQPQARLAQQLAEAGVGLLLTEHRLLSHLPEFAGTVLCLDSDEQSWTTEPESNRVSGSTASQLAYVIYTSGSTGVSKAVGVSHRNLVNYTEFHHSENRRARVARVWRHGFRNGHDVERRSGPHVYLRSIAEAAVACMLSAMRWRRRRKNGDVYDRACR